MKAAIFEKPGLENLKIKQDIEEPKITDRDVLIKVKMSGVNPIDHFTVSGVRETKPMPHIPGAETAGEVEKTGKHVTSVKQGDRVVVYGKVFDGTCDMCQRGIPSQCRNRTAIGITGHPGAFADYLALSSRNLHIVPDSVSDDSAVFVEPLAAALHFSPDGRLVLANWGWAFKIWDAETTRTSGSRDRRGVGGSGGGTGLVLSMGMASSDSTAAFADRIATAGEAVYCGAAIRHERRRR